MLSHGDTCVLLHGKHPGLEAISSLGTGPKDVKPQRQRNTSVMASDAKIGWR